LLSEAEILQVHFPGLPAGRARVYFLVEVIDDVGLFVNNARVEITEAYFPEIVETTNNTYHAANMVPVREYYVCYPTYMLYGTRSYLREPTYTFVPSAASRNNYGVPPGRLSTFFSGAFTYRYIAWGAHDADSIWSGNCPACNAAGGDVIHHVVNCNRPPDGIPHLADWFEYPECDCEFDYDLDEDCDCLENAPDPPADAWITEYAIHGVTVESNNSITLFFARDLDIFIHRRDYHNHNYRFTQSLITVPGARPFTMPLHFMNSFVHEGQMLNYRGAWSIGIEGNDFLNLPPALPLITDPRQQPAPIFDDVMMFNPPNVRHDINLFFVRDPMITINFHLWQREPENAPVNWQRDLNIIAWPRWQGEIISGDGQTRYNPYQRDDANYHVNEFPNPPMSFTSAQGIQLSFSGYYRLDTDPPGTVRGPVALSELTSLSEIYANRAFTLFYEPASTVGFTFTKVGDSVSRSYLANPVRNPLAGATFRLYRQNSAEGWTHIGEITEGEHAADTGIRTTGSDGAVEFTLTIDGVYRLVESAAPAHYTTPGGYWILSADDRGVITITTHGNNPEFRLINGGYYVGNTLTPLDFVFHKADERVYNQQNWADIESFLLSGAVFELYRFNGNLGHLRLDSLLMYVDPDCQDCDEQDCEIHDTIGNGYGQWTLVGTQTSSGDIATPIIFNMIPGRIYHLIETQAPDGYEIPGGQWRIWIQTDANGAPLFFEECTNECGECTDCMSASTPMITIEARTQATIPAFVVGSLSEHLDDGVFYLGNRQIMILPLSGELGSAWNLLLFAGLLLLIAGIGYAIYRVTPRKSKRCCSSCVQGIQFETDGSYICTWDGCTSSERKCQKLR